MAQPTSFLGNLSNLFTALGLTTLARMLPSNVTLTGGTINNTTIGNTTPAPGYHTSLSATGTSTFSGICYLATDGTTSNAQGVPNGQPYGLAIEWDYTSGGGEVDYISLYVGGSSGHNFYTKTSATAMASVAAFNQASAYLPYGLTLTGTLQGTYTLAAEQKIAVGQTAPMLESMSARMQFCIAASGILSVSTTNYIAWTNRFICMNIGANANTATNGYFDITMPAAGTTATGYGSASSRSWTSAGLSLVSWEALYYIPPIGAGNSTVAANFAIMGYNTASISVPPHWILICQCNGDTNLYSWLGGKVTMFGGQSFNTLTSASTSFYGGIINNTVIGGSVAASGSFTTLMSTTGLTVTSSSVNNGVTLTYGSTSLRLYNDSGGHIEHPTYTFINTVTNAPVYFGTGLASFSGSVSVAGNLVVYGTLAQTLTSTYTEAHPWTVNRSGGTAYQYVQQGLIGVYDNGYGNVWSFVYATNLFGISSLATTATPVAAWTVDSTGQAISLANGASYGFFPGSGLIVLNNYAGPCGAFLVGGGSIVLLGQIGNTMLAGGPTNGYICLYYDSNAGKYTVYNGTGATATIGFSGLRTRPAC